MLLRRSFLGMAVLGTSFAGAILPSGAASQSLQRLDLRGAIDAGENGVAPDGSDKAGRKLASLIARAAAEKRPLFLPPGTYQVGSLDLPDGARLTGIAGASRLALSGKGAQIRADGARRIELSDLVIDGAAGRPGEKAEGLLQFRGVTEVLIDNCEILAASGTAIQLERCGGRIERSRMAGAAEYGLYAVESTGLSVTGNVVEDCGNGGILIHRWSKGADDSIVSGNRIRRIGAGHGGTGQYGNAINLFRADNVMISGNHISQAAFSAIRTNSASNAQIFGNQCHDSGETAIYAEFAFEGAIVSDNVIDGAANGISVVNFNEGGRLATVSGNIVRNLRTTGPYRLDEAIFGVGISAEADTAISGNVIENAPTWGLALGFGPYLRNVIASGNIIRQSGVGCAVSVVEGAGSAIIAGNLFQAVTGGGIIGHRWKAPATGELAGGASQFANLTVENNRVV